MFEILVTGSWGNWAYLEYKGPAARSLLHIMLPTSFSLNVLYLPIMILYLLCYRQYK